MIVVCLIFVVASEVAYAIVMLLLCVTCMLLGVFFSKSFERGDDRLLVDLGVLSVFLQTSFSGRFFISVQGSIPLVFQQIFLTDR